MTTSQAKLYRETLRRSRKVMEELTDDALDTLDDEDKPKAKGKGKKVEKAVASSSNILMDLRKAASHPLLFRRLYTPAKVRQIAKACLNTPTWADSKYEYVVEDIEIMSDAEIHHFVSGNDVSGQRTR
jgi:SWI/SNF-related matrix-associated actin-dependent regulator 1 of chromatin subfamily A